MIGEAIFKLLTDDATVSGIVGNSVFPYMSIEEAQPVPAPYIIHRQIGNDPTQTKDGGSELDTLSVDVMCIDKTDQLTDTLSDAVRSVLERFEGTSEGNAIQTFTYRDNELSYNDKDRVFMITQIYTVRLLT